jgi:Flp pilus assembly pilin Flp
MNRVYRLWTCYGRSEPGQTMAEYALVVTLVAAAGLLVWATLGSNISQVINSIAGCI